MRSSDSWRRVGRWRGPCSCSSIGFGVGFGVGLSQEMTIFPVRLRSAIELHPRRERVYAICRCVCGFMLRSRGRQLSGSEPMLSRSQPRLACPVVRPGWENWPPPCRCRRSGICGNSRPAPFRTPCRARRKAGWRLPESQAAVVARRAHPIHGLIGVLQCHAVAVRSSRVLRLVYPYYCRMGSMSARR